MTSSDRSIRHQRNKSAHGRELWNEKAPAIDLRSRSRERTVSETADRPGAAPTAEWRSDCSADRYCLRRCRRVELGLRAERVRAAVRLRSGHEMGSRIEAEPGLKWAFGALPRVPAGSDQPLKFHKNNYLNATFAVRHPLFVSHPARSTPTFRIRIESEPWPKLPQVDPVPPIRAESIKVSRGSMPCARPACISRHR